jgi:hypothetical protein
MSCGYERNRSRKTNHPSSNPSIRILQREEQDDGCYVLETSLDFLFMGLREDSKSEIHGSGM